MSTRMYKIFKALSDETRLAIVSHLIEKKEISCQELQQKFNLSQPTLSHHFNKLIDNEILLVRKEGVQHFYSINTKALKDIGINIEKIVTHI